MRYHRLPASSYYQYRPGYSVNRLSSGTIRLHFNDGGRVGWRDFDSADEYRYWSRGQYPALR